MRFYYFQINHFNYKISNRFLIFVFLLLKIKNDGFSKTSLATEPEDVKRKSNLYRYQHYICKEYNIELNSYDDLWIWSNEHADLFWFSLFKYFELVYEGDIEPAYTGDVMPDITWFDNIRLNLQKT